MKLTYAPRGPPPEAPENAIETLHCPPTATVFASQVSLAMRNCARSGPATAADSIFSGASPALDTTTVSALPGAELKLSSLEL